MTARTDFIAALKRSIAAAGGLRALARRMKENPSKATLSRLQHGKPPDMATARRLGSVIGLCPCCGEKWPNALNAAERKP